MFQKPTHVSMFLFKENISLEMKKWQHKNLIYNNHSFVCSLNLLPQQFYFMLKFRTQNSNYKKTSVHFIIKVLLGGDKHKDCIY